MKTNENNIFKAGLAGILFAAETGRRIIHDDGQKRLKPCPKTRNCVSSYDKGNLRYIEPFRYKCRRGQARNALIEIITSMKRTEIVTSEADYIHAAFKSLVFRFKDDVEFLFEDDRKVIHVRSASRVGYSDLGVNRRRVEEIRRKFLEMSKSF